MKMSHLRVQARRRCGSHTMQDGETLNQLIENDGSRSIIMK